MIWRLRHADQSNSLRRGIFLDRVAQNEQRGDPNHMRAAAFQVLESSAHGRPRIDDVVDDLGSFRSRFAHKIDEKRQNLSTILREFC